MSHFLNVSFYFLHLSTKSQYLKDQGPPRYFVVMDLLDLEYGGLPILELVMVAVVAPKFMVEINFVNR